MELMNVLATVEVGDSRDEGNIQVFGLRWASGAGPAYVTADEALAAGTIEITEVTEGGSVPQLRLVNHGETAVLLLAGEQLVGAKQNRVLNTDVLAPAKSELPLPVTCVESGRWHYSSAKFASGSSMSHGKLRHMMSRHTHDSYRAEGLPHSDQHKVWTEVGRKLDSVGSSSPSHALAQAYADHGRQLRELVDKLPAPEGCPGALFVIHGWIAGVDLFDRSATLAKLWPKLLGAVALDALEAPATRAEPLAAEPVRRWLGAVPGARAEAFRSPGLGDDVRLEGPDLLGSALVVDHRPLHVSLFPGHV